jgi:hypothetical protein
MPHSRLGDVVLASKFISETNVGAVKLLMKQSEETIRGRIRKRRVQGGLPHDSQSPITRHVQPTGGVHRETQPLAIP